MAHVGIITFLHNDNYGSSLQAYALETAIRHLGHTCEHIDYLPDRTEKIKNLLMSGNSWKLIAEGLRKRSVLAGQEGAKRKNSAIPDFYRRQMRLSPRCRNRKELAAAARKYDVLICGSDQIWNPVWLNPAYFLTFAPEGKRKVAYAASLGVSELPSKQKIRKIRKWTDSFERISVREEEGAALILRMTGKTAEIMPDPVCLLTRDEWIQAATNPPDTDMPYLLCYFIAENEQYWQRVSEIREETGLTVKVIPVTAESYRKGFSLLDGIGPEAFAGAVRNASVLCTDSFHALVFGNIFEVRTELMRRYREDDRESKNSRVDHFLRMIRRKGLDTVRTEGIAWLRDAIGEAPHQGTDSQR